MRVCASCGVESPDGFRFCGGCGAPLAEDPAPARSERRVVTVLFADLVGFTSRSEQLDVEDVQAFLAPYQTRLRHEVERTGGVVSKFIGDGMMAVFGAPVAHEDDPERAVRTALGIREAVLDEVGSLHVRIGVTTGEALVSLGAAGDVDAVGDVVNTAARIESAAPTDGVLVDEVTHRATARVIRYEQAEAVSAKGKTEPVTAWLAIEPRSIVPEQARTSGLALVGRDSELAMLRSVFDRSRNEPSTQLVSIVGEPGIGKTRLVDELGEHIEDVPELITWRRGRSLSYGEGVAFWALGEMVKAQAGIRESDDAAAAEVRLREAVESIVEERDREWLVRHLRPLVGLDVDRSIEDERAEAFAAWRRFFEALAEDSPTVLAFEDIHWADDALLDFIDLLTERGGAIPLLIVCTARPELLQRRPNWGGGKPNAAAISLTPLTPEDTTRLISGLLDQALLPAEVQQTVLDHAEGNPLYAQEYVRMLQDRGALTRSPSGWTLTGQIDDLPESIQGIIAARLDTLPSGEKQLLQDASVIGRTAWVGAVGALSDESEWQAEEHVYALERKQLITRSRRSSVEGETEFTFTHALTRDVAYNQIRRADRARKHEAAAAWIEGLAGRRDDKAELLAYHYTTGLELYRSAGDDPPAALVDRARAALIEAGEQAAAVSAPAQSLSWFDHALELTPPGHADYPRVLFGQVAAADRARGGDVDQLEAAMEVLTAAEQWDEAARTAVMGMRASIAAGDMARGELFLGSARDTAERAGSERLSVAIEIAHAGNLIVRGPTGIDEGLAILDAIEPRALALGDDEQLAMLLLRRGDGRVSKGEFTTGLDDMRRGCRRQESNPTFAPMHNNLGWNLLAGGYLEEAEDVLHGAFQLSERNADAYTIASTAGTLAEVCYFLGSWRAALHWGERMMGDQFVLQDVIRRTIQGRIALGRGDADSVADDASRVVEHGSGAGYEGVQLDGFALLAAFHLLAGSPDDALGEIDRFCALWQASPAAAEVSCLAELSPVMVRLERHDDLRSAAELLPDDCRWKAALIASADGRHADAADRFGEIGSRTLQAHAYLADARAGSAESAAAAAVFFQEVGAKRYLADARALAADERVS